MSSRCTWSFRPFLLRSCFVTSCRGQRRAVGSIAGVLRSTGSCGSGGGGASPRRRNRPNAPSVRHGTVPAVAAPIRTRRTGLGRPAPRRPRRPSPSQSPPSARPHRKRAVKPAAKGALIAARRALAAARPWGVSRPGCGHHRAGFSVRPAQRSALFEPCWTRMRLLPPPPAETDPMQAPGAPARCVHRAAEAPVLVLVAVGDPGVLHPPARCSGRAASARRRARRHC